jgi:hypothetical protein
LHFLLFPFILIFHQVHLSCPRGTSISIEAAQLGKTNDPSLCPSSTEDTQMNNSVINASTQLDTIKSSDICIVPPALHVSYVYFKEHFYIWLCKINAA